MSKYPTPWRISGDVIEDAKGQFLVADVDVIDDECMERIVTAVNMHDELVAALTEMVDEFEGLADYFDDPAPRLRRHIALKYARAALAKVKP